MPDYRFVNANEKLEPYEIKNFQEQFNKYNQQVKPKDYQVMIIGDIVTFKYNYNPDTIISVKTPRKKTNQKIDKDSSQPQQEAFLRIQKDFKLTKKQIRELTKTLDKYNNKIMDLEKQIELYENEATKIKMRDDKFSKITEFYKSYDKFNECLTSQIYEFDSETKEDIKIKLNNLVLLEEDIITNYLK